MAEEMKMAYAYAMDMFQKTVYGIIDAESMEDAMTHLGDDADIVEVALPANVIRDANDDHRAKLAKEALAARDRQANIDGGRT